MNINLTALDFELLRNNDMAWADIVRHSADLPNRFEPVSAYTIKGKTIAAGYCWKRVYWFGSEYSAVFLAKTYLENLGQDYELLWDTAHDWDKPDFGYVILTDYERE